MSNESKKVTAIDPVDVPRSVEALRSSLSISSVSSSSAPGVKPLLPSAAEVGGGATVNEPTRWLRLRSPSKAVSEASCS